MEKGSRRSDRDRGDGEKHPPRRGFRGTAENAKTKICLRYDVSFKIVCSLVSDAFESACLAFSISNSRHCPFEMVPLSSFSAYRGRYTISFSPLDPLCIRYFLYETLLFVCIYLRFCSHSSVLVIHMQCCACKTLSLRVYIVRIYPLFLTLMYSFPFELLQVAKWRMPIRRSLQLCPW